MKPYKRRGGGTEKVSFFIIIHHQHFCIHNQGRRTEKEEESLQTIDINVKKGKEPSQPHWSGIFCNISL